MSVPLLIEVSDLEAVIGPARVAQLFTNDGSGKARAEQQRRLLQDASDTASRYLGPGWTVDELVAIVRSDGGVRRLIAWIAVGMSAEGRPEFADQQGRFLFAAPYGRAIEDLTAMGTARQRTLGEKQTGATNRLIGTRIKKMRGQRQWVFADGIRHRGSGGF